MRKIISIIISAILSLSIVACSTNSAKGTVSSFCNAMKKFDTEGMAKCTGHNNFNLNLENTGNAYADSFISIAKKYSNKMTYKIVDEVVNGDTSNVTVEFEYLDVSDAVMFAMKELYNFSQGRNLGTGLHISSTFSTKFRHN